MKLPDTTLLNPDVPRHAGYTGKLKAIILDWAGTTVDYGSLAPVRTLQQVFERADLPITEPEARRDMGIQKKDHIRAILSIPRVSDAWMSLRNHPPSESDVEALYQQFVPLQFSCLLEYSTVLPGIPEAVERLRRRGLKIGTSTGYTREMLAMLVAASAESGYTADCNLCPDDVAAGRPHPYMIFEIAVRLQVYPLAAIVKIGDTPSDIYEGLNAGTWTVGIAATGNMNGLSREEFSTLSPGQQQSRLAVARAELQKAGAHFVVDAAAEVDAVLDEIDARISAQSAVSVSSAASPR